MVSCALLYNFTGKKAEMTKMVCMMMNIRFKSVMAEEMLLLHGFNSDKLQKFLTALQRVGVGRIDLKAMLTENNRTWSGLDLYEELCQERDYFKQKEEEKRRQQAEDKK